MAAALALAIVISEGAGFGMNAKADSCGGLVEADVYFPEADEVIQDPVLHWAIRSAMNAIEARPKLTAEMVGSSAVRDISFEQCSHAEDFKDWTMQFWIEDLEGIQYAKSATMVDICYTSAVEGKRIADVSPLSALTQLSTLILKQDGISDISSLETLVNLELFDVSGNRLIEDVSAVQNMRKLKRLILSSNAIQNIEAISNLSSLEYIDISNNKIAVLPDLKNLENVYFLDASHNKLTDISSLSSLKNLRELNLSGNEGITDLKPLAGLLNLDKEKTFLPDELNKEDLFAAIEVNKLFHVFNISRMKESDLENVNAALDAYEALTPAQKEYMEAERVQAALTNKQRIENGQEPEYYPEYDEGGEEQPVLDRLEIKVVDKNGNPMPGVAFTKTMTTNVGGKQESTVNADASGVLALKHTAMDGIYDQITVTPSGDQYVSQPKEIIYTVINMKTETINGAEATGFEKLQFVLIENGEYVDKTGLEETINKAGEVEDAYKYTAASYQSWRSALENAKDVYDNPDATEAEVEDAINQLETALKGLTKAEHLTALKLIVKDANGNIFTRPFKFQIKVPGTGAEAWNQTTDPYTGITCLQASPAWQDGKQWEITACYEEPYDIEPITVTIGSENGESYYKTVNGQTVDVDFEQTVVVKLRADGAIDQENERKPDSTVLQEYVNGAAQYQEADYTASTYQALQAAVQNAENILEKQGAIQEDYNAAAAMLKQAEAELRKPANKVALKRAISLESSYTESMYTSSSWAVYQNALTQAKGVNDNQDATQEQVDEALGKLQSAQNALVLRANKTVLEQKIAEAEALKAEDYESGFEELQRVLLDAKAVYNDPEAEKAQVDAQVEAIDEAMDALVKKAVEVDYRCDPGVFKAKVMDKSGKAISGVKFEAVIDGVVDTSEEIISDSNGIIRYYVYGINRKKTTTIRLADERYSTEDIHWFTADGINDYIVSMLTIDDQPYNMDEDVRLTYTLKNESISGMQTLTIPVIDREGNPVPDNVKFIRHDVKYLADKTMYVRNGQLEWEPGAYDSGDYEIYLPEDSAYIATPGMIKVSVGLEDGEPVIETINGQPAEEGMAYFKLSSKGTDTCDLLTFRAVVQDSDGNPLSGICFYVKNGDPDELISDENGLITYHISAWDTDTTMTLTLQDGQEWIMERETSFSVIVDPEDPDRGILSEIDGEQVTENEKVVITLAGKPEEPVIITLPFIDTSENSWYYEAVAYVYQEGLMTGKDETTFAPDENLARAQFAVILHRMNGTPEMTYDARFPDVEAGIWYTDAILWASEQRIVTGYSDTGCFGPADNINREQMATMMYRYAQSKGYDVSRRADFSEFADAGKVSAYADEAMQWAVGNGIISGKDNGTVLDPQGNATRAECATIMMRFMEKYN